MSWQSVTLGDHAALIRGVTYKPADIRDYLEHGAVACMRTKNVQEQLDQSDIVGIPGEIVKRSDKILRAGDILVSSANSWNLVGKCCWVPQLDYQATAGGFISILRPKDEKLDNRYLYHWFSSGAVQHVVRSFGNKTTNISNLSHKRCLGMKIPLPPLDEQKRIAKILDEADALRAKRRESLAQLDALLQSAFLDLFGDPVENPKKWKTLPFSEVGSFKSGGTPSKANNLYWGEGFPWVSPKDMKVDRVYESKDSITSLALSETNMRLVDPGHILIVVRGMILAHSFPVAVNNVSVAINQDMKAIRPIESINSDYLLYCLKAKKREVMDLVSSAGHGTRRFDRNAMNELQVPVPDIALQEKFSILCNSLQKQKIRLVKYAEELNGLFGALQTKAFSGEL
ncbi:restriction endonuclease subunit S [Alloalcanivorax sp. C16-2]|uniref:restriction endonuclease subunit S n=1 Tax=Alloalcanivorax sp. C16-2 TaxID=3390052 RepID=UPI003970D7A8